MKSGRQVGSLSDDRIFLRGSFSNNVPNYHRTGRDANTHGELVRSFDVGDLASELKTRANRTLSIILMCLRISEIS